MWHQHGEDGKLDKFWEYIVDWKVNNTKFPASSQPSKHDGALRFVAVNVQNDAITSIAICSQQTLENSSVSLSKYAIQMTVDDPRY